MVLRKRSKDNGREVPRCVARRRRVCRGVSPSPARISPQIARISYSPAPKTSEATRSAASSCIAGIACEYVSRVIEIVLCPSRSETTFGWTPAWFREEDGSPLSPNAVSNAWKHRVSASGLPRVRLHDLRHTHATLATDAPGKNGGEEVSADNTRLPGIWALAAK